MLVGGASAIARPGGRGLWLPPSMRAASRQRVPVRRHNRSLSERLLALFSSIQWKHSAGMLWKTGGGIAFDPACCCGGGGGPAPCSCPGGLASTYTVSGFGGLTGCPSCDASSDPAWSGVLYYTGTPCIWWAADSNFDPLSINGKKLDITYTQIDLCTTCSPCRWELFITCESLTAPPANMWVGYKTTGSTPVGTYNFNNSDCGNTTATMTVT